MSRVALPCLAALLLAGAVGCSKQTVEERAREQAEKIQKELADYDTAALEQKVDPAVVSEVQTQLTAIKEYQGEINGQIDGVTINAIQAFQRTAGLHDTGVITDETRTRLAAAAQQAGTTKQ
ncbi:MAG: peptidoglycan-binding domain-containing protein [Deltaproteobacteria bacterium]|nr:peptidoglycan-binding domain-containing protein [Deltaproteobacteria bacterium]